MPGKNTSVHLLGGQDLSYDEYKNYLMALSVKPFLSTKEASILFDIGIGRMQLLMKRSDVNFVLNKGKGMQRFIENLWKSGC